MSESPSQARHDTPTEMRVPVAPGVSLHVERRDGDPAAMPFVYTAQRSVKIHRYLGLASGVLSLAFGLFLVYQIGIGDGLFTSNPRWTPK